MLVTILLRHLGDLILKWFRRRSRVGGARRGHSPKKRPIILWLASAGNCGIIGIIGSFNYQRYSQCEFRSFVFRQGRTKLYSEVLVLHLPINLLCRLVACTQPSPCIVACRRARSCSRPCSSHLRCFSRLPYSNHLPDHVHAPCHSCSIMRVQNRRQIDILWQYACADKQPSQLM